jgi:flavodoxin
MKTKLFLILLMSAVLTACSGAGPKVLIAYYSQSGSTRAVAEQIQARFGGDLFEIQTAIPYPASEMETIELVDSLRNEGIRPELAALVPNMGDYDVVFVGTPIWFGTASLPVFSFVEAHDFTGKTVVPFYTCGRGDVGTYVEDITPFLNGATILAPIGNNRTEREAGTHTAKVAAELDQITF